MASRYRHWLRVGSFALGFSLFGLQCLLLSLSLIAATLLGRGSREERQLRAQGIVHRHFRFFVGVLRAFDIAQVTVVGEERLREPGAHLLVANHPTLIDVVVIGALMPQLDCVVKRAAWSNPFMVTAIRATGYLANDDGVSLVEAGAEQLRRGRSLLLFPEGTRSPLGGLQPFQRGAAHLALRTGLPILPLHIRCEPRGLMKGQKWWDVPPDCMRFRVEICAPIHAKDLVEPGEPRGRSARRLTAALRDFYEKKLHTGA